jgi:hypothetical protein
LRLELRGWHSTGKGTPMFSKMTAVAHPLLAVVLGSAALLGQQTPVAPACQTGCEFPAIMRQNVVAGKTAVGTKVEARLVVATLVNGGVIPRDAILSGEVTESVAKSATDPSRLAIRMDSAQWKNGSAPLKVYLTAWIYPEAALMNQDLSYQPPDAANSKGNWNGMGAYPDPNNRVSQQKFPAADLGKDDTNALPSPASSISKHRVLMKNVESLRNTDGAVFLTSQRSNIKLDKFTTYVLAASDLLPAK